MSVRPPGLSNGYSVGRDTRASAKSAAVARGQRLERRADDGASRPHLYQSRYDAASMVTAAAPDHRPMCYAASATGETKDERYPTLLQRRVSGLGSVYERRPLDRQRSGE